MNLPVVVDAHPKSRTLGAMIVELAIVEPWLALTNVGDIGPPIYVGFTAFLGEIKLEAKPIPNQKQIHA